MKHIDKTSYFNNFCVKNAEKLLFFVYRQFIYKDTSEIKWCCSEKVNVAHPTGLKIFCCQVYSPIEVIGEIIRDVQKLFYLKFQLVQCVINVAYRKECILFMCINRLLYLNVNEIKYSEMQLIHLFCFILPGLLHVILVGLIQRGWLLLMLSSTFRMFLKTLT